MIWITAAVATLAGVLGGLTIRAWLRGEPISASTSRAFVAAAALALAFDLAGGPSWVGILAALLLLSGVVLRVKSRAA